jgi:hypothetical protein
MPSVTLSSAGTASIITDFIGAKTTSVAVSFISSISSAFLVTPIEITLDSSAQGSSTVRWFRVTSAASAILASTTSFDTGLFQTFLTPIAGVRITSTNAGSGIVMDVLQTSGG